MFKGNQGSLGLQFMLPFLVAPKICYIPRSFMIWLKRTCCHPFATAVCVRFKLRESGHFFFFPSEQRKVYCWAKQGEQMTPAKKYPGVSENQISMYIDCCKIFGHLNLWWQNPKGLLSSVPRIQCKVMVYSCTWVFTICFRRKIKDVMDWIVILLLRYYILLWPHKLKTARNVFMSNTISVLLIRKMITFSSVNLWKIQ